LFGLFVKGLEAQASRARGFSQATAQSANKRAVWGTAGRPSAMRKANDRGFHWD